MIAFDHGYHGRTNLTMALPYKDGFGPFAGEIYRAPMAYPFRWATGAQACAAEAFEAFEAMVHTQVGESRVAAGIIEPIQGEGGFIVPPEGFLSRLSQWCTDNGALLIADEVQTGFCRTGDWFACDADGVVPDLVTTAKGIAGGLPLAGVTGRADIMDSVHPRRPGRHLRPQPGRVRRSARGDPDDARSGPGRARSADRDAHARAAAGDGRGRRADRGRPRA